PESYSLAALVHFVVPSWTAAIAVETLVGAGVLTLALLARRRGRAREALSRGATPRALRPRPGRVCARDRRPPRAHAAARDPLLRRAPRSRGPVPASAQRRL